jgi:hypothetical protein
MSNIFTLSGITKERAASGYFHEKRKCVARAPFNVASDWGLLRYYHQEAA